MTRPLPWHHPRRWGSAVLVWALMAQMLVPAHAYVSQLPGAFTAPPDPNVMFTLDDSRSMWSDVIPDLRSERDSLAGIPGIGNEQQFPEMWSKDSPFLAAAYYQNSTATAANQVGRYLRSAATNPIYYDPKVQYRPWPREPDSADPSNALPAANPRAVNIDRTDPRNSAQGVIDLTATMGTPAFWPATYFIQTSSDAVPTAQPNSTASRNAAFEKVEIQPLVASYPKRHASGEIDKRTDCAAAASCSYAEELQNFANWLQYYRSRSLMAKGAVALAFSRQGTNLRVGFGTINDTVQLGVRTFDSATRRAFYERLYQSPANGSTPLRMAMTEVGEYFRGNGVGNPWAEFPETSTIGKEHSCRRSFHILSTDGFWNSDTVTVGNADNLAGEQTPPSANGPPVNFSDAENSRFGISPFADTFDNTLADVAAFYWKTDLRNGPNPLTNNVIPSSRDPAFWQHLTTYTVGLGITGTGGVTLGGQATVPTVLPADHPLRGYEGEPWLKSQVTRDWLIATKASLTWTQPGSNLATTGDDLIHAALNGHGRYMTATNPTELASNLSSALAEAVDNPGDLATLAVDSAQVLSNGRLYQAIFSPSRWYGRLYAFTQDPNGKVNNTPIDALTTNLSQVWEASNKMPAPAARNIFTSRGGLGSGTLFAWDALSTTQQGHLGNSRVLDYLRGDPTYEVSNDGPFRDRSRYTVNGVTGGVLGDVIGGSPLKGPAAGGGYDRLPNTTGSGQDTYATFRSATGPLAEMLDTMFLGANDGMLHAFNLTNGVERFAYVPSTVYNVPRSTAGGLAEQKLRMLSDPEYTHRFTVDGPPNVADAFIGGQWRSLLVGTTGAGARGMFVVDVTKPNAGNGDFDASKILWEFTEADSTDMGFVLAYPHVVRMRNGQWAVISGNGYDSETGRAVLYIRDAATGVKIQEFAVGPTGGNGMSQPNFVLNASREVIAIYAGDLKGNLWKFDVSATDATTWAPAFGTSPLFAAVGPSGLAQPITVMPEISAHPNGGAMVIFGTGKLFEPSDTSTDTGNTSAANVNLKGRQSLYGIWDAPAATAGVVIDATTRSTLLKQQDYVASRAGDNASFKRTSGEAPDWSTQRGWVFDLAAGGERANLPAQQFRNVVFMAANTPAVADPCSNSGTSKIFALDPITGAVPAFAVFDTNGDSLFDAADRGLNVLLNGSALLTQPVFQLSSSGTTATTGPTVQPIAALDRGQATAARPGGVELSRANGSKTPPSSGGTGGEPDCKALLSAAQSNTNLLQQLIQGCSLRARISWRQLQ